MRIRIASVQFWANAGTLPAELDLVLQYPAASIGRLETTRVEWAGIRQAAVAAAGGELRFQDAMVVLEDRVGQDLRSPEFEPLETAVRRLDACGLALAAKHLLTTSKEARCETGKAEARHALELVVGRVERLYAAELAFLRSGQRLSGSDLDKRGRDALRRYLALGNGVLLNPYKGPGKCPWIL